MLRQARFRLEVLLQHPMPFCIHRSGVGWTRLENFERQTWIDIASTRELQAFRKHGAVQSENQIQNEFHSCAASRGPNVVSFSAALGENIRAPVERVGATAADEDRFLYAH